ncbi:hypothetical protein [Winogradskyella forsetii]|uniref:hypothetical protein n=1 Tax=Winogradskyella forsetii TaxID=2686077 RepID=UPI0015BCBCCF|nr:hypothetical protein [Winogradskyella forsetii]
MVITIKRGASKEGIRNVFESLKKELKPKGVNTYEYVGKVKLEKDALSVQRILRDEWE